MAKARTVGIKSREKSILNFMCNCLKDGFLGVAMNDGAFYNILGFNGELKLPLYTLYVHQYPISLSEFAVSREAPARPPSPEPYRLPHRLTIILVCTY